jgi:diguanylate cyclase (GGDEF)-like protein/PAS domain S-box-containing protein
MSLAALSARVAIPRRTDETREIARLARVSAAVMFVFALASLAIVATTGDPATAAAAVIQFALVLASIYARRQVLLGRSQRGVMILVASVWTAVLAMAPLPPPVPALAAAPIMAVAFALSFLDGGRLKVVLVVTWLVSLAAAIIVEFTPASPDLSPALASGLRVGSFAGIVALVALVLYRHRRRLDLAVSDVRKAGDALGASEARYRTAVEGIREVIFRLDADGRFTFLNHAWEEVTGYQVADSIGRLATDYLDPVDRELHTELTRPAVDGQGEENRHEFRMVGSRGNHIWVEANSRAIRDDAGLFDGVFGTLADISVRRELEERLVVQAFHDDLTGLANRALFKDRVEHGLMRRLHGRHPLALLFLDLDRFKTVNDSLGHQVGDRLLIAIAERLRAVLRPEDTIARFGGDEFAILVDDLRTPQEVFILADRISSAFDAPFRLNEREITIRSSIGVVLASSAHESADDLLRDADVAMYRAKASDLGSYALFEPSMQTEVAARLELESDLRDAIAHESLTLAYQPIVDLRDGRIVGVEALARWSHPERGVVSPSVFIPSAEESGLILPLGVWVLRRACRDIADLRRAGGAAADLRLSVNVSPRQLADRGIVDVVLGSLRDAGLPSDALILEITESLVLDSGEEGLGFLRALRAAGCRVAFDDFGTGFSSLGNLRSMPIDGLKIDMSFVGAMLESGVEAAIVDAVVRLGAALGVEVVAEGVEDAATAERLKVLGCPFAQGYFFGRPEPIAELGARIAMAASPPAAA